MGYRRVFNTLLVEFTPHAIEALASFLESCGRYLYLQPEAHHRCTTALAVRGDSTQLRCVCTCV